LNSTNKSPRLNLSTQQLVRAALFTALVIVFAIIPPLPMPFVPVPLTLQTLGVMLAGLILSPRLAALAMLLYVVLALVGFPVLPGGRGGLAVFAGPTGGFILGFIPGAFVVSWLAARRLSETTTAAMIARNFGAAVFGGAIVVYAIGVPWLAMVTGMTIDRALMAVVVFLPGDLVKAVIATIVALRVAKLQIINNP
jgi:biotin transport system substrate-specific component